MYNECMNINVSVASYNGKDGRQFSYTCPDTLPAAGLQPGQIVTLPFGKKTSLGVVRELNAKKPSGIKLSSVKEILELPPLAPHQLKLADWMIEYYVAPASSVWQLFLPKNASSKPRKKFGNAAGQTEALLKLSKAQDRALKKINQARKPVLLQGVMGSGKTELYFHLIAASLGQNKSSVILMPEIFLTNQMITRAKKHFGDKLLVTHSQMSAAERRHFWDQCNLRSQDSAVVVLGPRSALFAPLHNLGLVIIDECHEQSYKQDAAPRYQTEFVAARLAQLSGSQLVLGSATPSVSTRYLADLGKLELVEISERAMSSAHPNTVVADMQKGSSMLSAMLSAELKDCVDSKHSALLYLNRRGTAPLYMCSDCGQGFECKYCGVNLHFHADSMQLVCHICSHTERPAALCPSCGSTNLRGVGVGTKAIEQVAAELLPGSTIVRIDKDNAKSKDFAQIIEAIQSAKVDVIVGTQMLGRGLDLDKLQLVGIVNADYDLLNADFNGRERAFQLIAQAAGRAGRRDTQGKVIIQTKNPQNPLVGYIASNDFEGFYKDELSMRKKYSYPPFAYLLKLECGFVNENFGKTKAEELIGKLRQNPKLQILGPAKAYPFIRKRKKFWKVVVKGKSRQELQKIARELDRNWIINLDPFGIS